MVPSTARSPVPTYATAARVPLVDPAIAAAERFPLDRWSREWLHDVRWRRPEYDRRRIGFAVAVAVLLHVLLALLVRDWMQPRVPVEDRRDVIHVTLYDEPVVVVPEPAMPVTSELPPLRVDAPDPGVATNAPAPTRPETAARAAARPMPRDSGSEGVVATPRTENDVPTVRLYSPDGSVEVPADGAVADNEFIPREIEPAELMKHKSPLPFERTKLDQAWVPDDENVFKQFVREKTVTKKIRTRWGGQITCTWALIAGGCGWGYTPPPIEGMQRDRFNPPVRPTIPQDE
jgi:hypothetical protein